MSDNFTVTSVMPDPMSNVFSLTLSLAVFTLFICPSIKQDSGCLKLYRLTIPNGRLDSILIIF